MSNLRCVSVKRPRSWIGLRTGTINKFLSQTPNRLPQRRIGLTWQISTCSFTVTSFLSWKSAPKVLIVRNTKIEVELDAWRRLSHKNDLCNLLRDTRLLERLLAPTQIVFSDVAASMERLDRARAASVSPEIWR